MAGTGEEERLALSDVAATTSAASAAAPAKGTAPQEAAPQEAAPQEAAKAAETTAVPAATGSAGAAKDASIAAPAATNTPAVAESSTAATVPAESSSAAAAPAAPAAHSAPAASSTIVDASVSAPIEPAAPVGEQTTDTEGTGTDDAAGFSDVDSAVGSLSYSSLTSLTDSIREFRHENGRTYHSLSAGKYWCPNDDPENSRLDIQHHAHRLTFDGALCRCPKESGAKRVLDLGTGTGIWAMEYADEHPDAEVIGVDLSPIQPEFVPPNCSFEVDDIEKEWTWTKPFDFIWWRALLGCFSDAQAMVQKCFDNLEPGGYLEMHDGTFPPECDDGTLTEDSALLQLTKLAAQASANLGRPIDVSPQYARMMEEAGFVDIVFAKYKWPTNPWPRDRKMKTIGYWTLANVEPGLEGLFLALLTRGAGMTKEETMVLCAQARNDLRNPNIHAYWPAYYCYGRKPE
ncbi:methyltransferase domain containing protein [Sporothrix brasiliensis 5110]|uniref:Methyltransferase domain containing protein n=1 Tax=Sporothrix brasiliensis 5110 TaxID=1398154 RepID=A0A0C2IL49_9PEZI|nr:methyltransferase domain containing protein [Sporothrix brasiliensis 5110]KIH87705.1 methyltransferase domain containing protein [Sporothrix brasiliensis 5110]